LAVFFTCNSSYTAVAYLSNRNSVSPSVCPSVTWVDQSKTVQARITNGHLEDSIVSGSVELFHKFERGHPQRGC